MFPENRTGYGMLRGKLVYIDDVSRGLACGCVCSRCGTPLVAKKGSKRQKHFAHYEVTNCLGAGESVLHLLAKDLIAELRVFVIPPYDFVKQRRMKSGTLIQYKERVAKGGRVPIKAVRVEMMEDGFIPDIIIDSGSKLLIVEVAVTHKVGGAKLRRIRRRNLPAIEIRLDLDDSFLPRELLKRKLQEDLKSKSWIFHPSQREAERKFVKKFRSRLRTRRTSREVFARRYSEDSRDFRSYGNEYDRMQEEFFRFNKRYPSVEECLRLRPDLWRPKSPSR
jgi:hypothetical protein